MNDIELRQSLPSIIFLRLCIVTAIEIAWKQQITEQIKKEKTKNQIKAKQFSK